MGNFRPTPEEMRNLRDYKYHSVKPTAVDNLLNSYFWTPISRWVPDNVHPNVLTLLALIFSMVAVYLPLRETGSFVEAATPITYLLSAFGIFLHQTLDAIDGKQARRLGLSSPVGQLLDHGFDSLTVFFSAFLSAHALKQGNTVRMPLMVFGVTLQLFFYSWHEYTYGTFRSATGQLGVTEGQLLLMFELVFAALYPSWVALPIVSVFPFLSPLVSYYPFSQSVGQFGYDLSIVLLYWMSFQDILGALFFERPPDSNVFWCWPLFFLHASCNALLVYNGVLMRYPVLVSSIITLAGSLVAWKLIIASTTTRRLPGLSFDMLLFYTIVLEFAVGPALSPGKQSLLLWVLLFQQCISWLHFVLGNVLAMKNFLRINLFVVPKATKAPARLSRGRTTAEK